MKQIKIIGNQILSGTVEISGAKNAAVALVPASLLSDGIVKLDNIPNISDISALNEILTYLGATVKRDEGTMTIDSSSLKNKSIPKEISSKLRASYYFMAALLGKYKRSEMYFPGGCNIGARPIDQTLKAFERLGATVKEEQNRYIIEAEELIGNDVYLDMPSVGATINTMLVAVKAHGQTIIHNAAREPEIVSVATFLNNMGGKISGAGTNRIIIQGVETLSGCFTEVIPDRIEAGTYLIAGALIGQDLTIKNIIPNHIDALISKLKEIGIPMEIGKDYIKVSKGTNLKPVKVQTQGYPGFVTDLQQPFTTILTQCNGKSSLEETIYENRFNNIPYLNQMGSNIEILDNNKKIAIYGPTKLHGAKIEATDLRAGAGLILAALIADGETTITSIEHVLRGYENIIGKLTRIGAKIKIEEI